jgi:16S rRNA G527 N7-methylase RsmG
MITVDFNFEEAIPERARVNRIILSQEMIAALASHARSVLRSNERLHLTTITEPEEFMERHFGESFEGASLISSELQGTMLDLGSGNGFPGLPFYAARPGLKPYLAEGSSKKSGFLGASTLAAGLGDVEVLALHIQRPGDMPEGLRPDVWLTRAMGGWEKILPRFARTMHENDRILLWAGEEVEAISRRKIWKRLRIEKKHVLPGLDRGWIWVLASAEPAVEIAVEAES